MRKVVVAMSGGVDSAVAAAVCKQHGDEVIGVHMRLHDEVQEEVPRSCCGQRDALDARAVCEHLGIPFYVTDYRKQFQAAVMDKFVSEYKAGRTPIPCVACNGVLKFNLLLKQAEAIGCDMVATGHYAMKHCGSGPVILRHWDERQDQSYFLYSVRAGMIPKIYFPLIAYRNKAEVREAARTFGLPIADKLDSQDICFIPDGNHKKFLADHIPEDMSAVVVDEDGTTLGHVDSYVGFTVGQRRGLKIALAEPVYIKAIDPENKRITVTRNAVSLATNLFQVENFNWHTDDPSDLRELDVRVRHRASLTGAQVVSGFGTSHVTIRANAPVVAVPGQAAVLYADSQLIGGGTIV